MDIWVRGLMNDSNTALNNEIEFVSIGIFINDIVIHWVALLSKYQSDLRQEVLFEISLKHYYLLEDPPIQINYDFVL